jgi:diguanylate cyclase (GGDEF)-like protein
MRLHLLKLPRLIARRRGSAILGVILIAVVWASVFLLYRGSVQQAFEAAERRNQNYAALFEENVLRSIGEIDKAILYLRHSVELKRATTDYQTIVQTTDILSEIIVQVAIIDANGIARATNAVREPTPGIDIRDREHFQVHVNSTEDKLFISKPVIGRASQKWSIQFTRRFSNPDGSFAGVVVASMDPMHFTKVFDEIELETTTSVALIGDDGVVRASGGDQKDQLVLGQDIEDTGLFGLIRSGTSGLYSGTDNKSSPQSLITAHKIRGYPLWVAIATELQQINRQAKGGLIQNSIIAASLTLLALCALEWILHTESDAEQKAGHLSLTLAHITQGIMLVTKDCQVPVINRRCGELLKLPKPMTEARLGLQELIDYQVQSGDTKFAEVSTLGQHAPAPSVETEIRDYRRPDGTYIEVRKTGLPDGGFVQTLTDITSRREAESHIARLASLDPLTNLPNRRVFQAALEEMTAREPNTDQHDETGAAILFLDLDRFKIVNDTLGHRVGDLLLIEVAKRLKTLVGEGNVLARLGGDEFAICLFGLERRAQIEELGSRIVDELSRPVQIDHHRMQSSVSIGIAVAPFDGTTADELLVAADLALYAVKNEQRGTYKFYQKSLNNELMDRRQIEVDLCEALEAGQLELHYQPVVDLRHNTITAFEALARWRHPIRGMISPAKFIAIAEDCGLIIKLGEWALTEACRAAARWCEDLDVAVNLSPVQLSDPELLSKMESILDETGLAARRLVLEITERTFLNDSERTLSVLHRLKQLGVRISLDDFGTGYSSLSYLRSFPFDIIKVDRSFVADFSEDPSSRLIVQGVILIADGLGIRTVAEGVETEAQRQMLKILGCNEMQGYLVSPAVPVGEVDALVAEWVTKSTIAA